MPHKGKKPPTRQHRNVGKTSKASSGSGSGPMIAKTGANTRMERNTAVEGKGKVGPPKRNKNLSNQGSIRSR
jgi:hypothetical protein